MDSTAFQCSTAHAEKKKYEAGVMLDTPGETDTYSEKSGYTEQVLKPFRFLGGGRAERGAKTKFEGVLAMLTNRWRNAKSGIIRRMLEST